MVVNTKYGNIKFKSVDRMNRNYNQLKGSLMSMSFTTNNIYLQDKYYDLIAIKYPHVAYNLSTIYSETFHNTRRFKFKVVLVLTIVSISILLLSYLMLNNFNILYSIVIGLIVYMLGTKITNNYMGDFYKKELYKNAKKFVLRDNQVGLQLKYLEDAIELTESLNLYQKENQLNAFKNEKNYILRTYIKK